MAGRSRFRTCIVLDLRNRNEKEKRFGDVVKLCNSLHESVDFLEKENQRLKIHKMKLEQQNFDVDISADNVPNNALVSLQKKIYQLQTELTELHKNKGEHAQQVIELRRSVDEKEEEIREKNLELQKAEAALKVAIEQSDQLEEKATDAEMTLQLIKDEYSALLLTYYSVKKAKEELEAEHTDLTTRWLAYKAKAADELNTENELMQKLKQMKVQKDMEEAVREPVSTSQSSSKFGPCS